MKIASILLILAAALIAGVSFAATVTPQIGGGISQFDGGIASSGGAVVTPVGCTPTGLDFSQACNSMYLL
jgi:hypothetical protein